MTKMLNKYTLASLLAVAAIVAAPLFANAQTQEAKTRTYSYDVNHDGFIQPGEFTTYLYTRSDADGDGYLGDEEWTMTTTQLYRPYKDVNYNTYTYWDQDKNGRLDANEMSTVVEKTGLYSKWDTNLDTKVDNDEFLKGTFNAYDDNNDGAITLNEWQNVVR